MDSLGAGQPAHAAGACFALYCDWTASVHSWAAEVQTKSLFVAGVASRLRMIQFMAVQAAVHGCDAGDLGHRF